MARSSAAVTLAVVATLACVMCTSSYRGLVGGKSEVADVKSNKEVQELGRFSVEEYNRNLRVGEKEEELDFVEVVAAQQQVVSGIKYYMKISAASTQSDGGSRMFDSVVVVKPWLRSKQLLNFAPSPPSTL